MEATIDEKGRVVIPRVLREGMGLRVGAKVRLVLEEGKIILMKPLAPEEFIREIEGCVKEGSPIPKVDPLDLKRIWERL